MKRLLIDAGNTRLKWRSAAGARLGRLQSAAWTRQNLQTLAARVLRAGRGAEAVLVCNVAGGAMEGSLRAAARAAGLPAPRFIVSARSAAGVHNGYARPRQLGVDRWLSLIGARYLYPDQPVCVISCGTATTIDLLDRNGLHRGGAIVPGPELMVGALLRNTALIRRRAQRGIAGDRRRLFASDTRAAIEGGARHARLAVIGHALHEGTALLGAPPGLVLTGGGAAEVAIGGRAVVQPALIFIGLLVLAGAGKD
jgi:type III pantothenate kinase